MRGNGRRILGLAVAAAALALGGRAFGQQPPGPRVVIDFEDQALGSTVTATKIACEFVPDPTGGPGNVGKWTVPVYDGNAMLDFKNVPTDLTPWKFLRFRLRRESGDASTLVARIQTTRSDEVTVRIPGVGKAWRTYEFDMDRFTERGAPDLRKVKNITLAVVDKKEGVFYVDDVQLDTAPLPPAPAEVERRAAKSWTIAALDGEGPLDTTETAAGSLAVAEEKGNRVLRWTLEAGARPSSALFYDVPRELDDYLMLRLRIRAEGDPGRSVILRFKAGFTDALRYDIKALPKKWTEMEIPLGLFEEDGEFDVARLDGLAFEVFEGSACTIFLDDIRLERGAGDAASVEKARFEYVFGKGGAAKGIHFQVADFDCWTDSRAAVDPVTGGLDKAYKFILETLGLPPVRKKIPVYVFQNLNGLRDFLVRARGWSKKSAEGVAAVGNASYVAFYYRVPDDPAMVRNVTQSVFHRSRGRQGGSWFQSGIGRYVSALWEKKSKAEEFAPRIRSKAYVPLAEFVAIPDLFKGIDVKGGAGESDSLFLQAAALQEFLRRGPLKEKWAQAEPVVARMAVKDKERAETLEKILGISMADLEKAWVEWGSNPPKE